MLQTKKILTVRCSNYCLARVLEVSASESDRESLLRRDERAVEKDGDFVYYDSASEEKLDLFELFQDRIELFG
ncbi:hypothetical protein [Leptospira borgpetersenii]|uniref:hypothetical protein n=1 Tax=Leptospira borgpetersenii TaxID=174 RepID=UPI0003488EA1|nr:hypothetical protein [Leptospira borgpetersenii]AMX57805.1 hypothetical protein LBK6_05405 [Leptospira borgpetersenii serovar Hardjo]AMX61038.1 hypothetical protein LBK9_05340 [Leptospira borgpetersenii serovar Hardjo]AMX64281.1 hypothetical protein LBK30_05370 [Leptospira borgpetersenii serovar Hardjo]AMX67522.1 hypothetical protein LBHA_05355 [Leptospira borgpetersenii serovar Hardjo]AWV69679.1 hypothetical protein B9T54_05885 [Leptospira borgpetersenii serovar Hardjo-bovis]